MSGAKMLHVAFETWNAGSEPLESVEARIHDGVPIEQLHDRANGYLNTLYTLYPYAAPRSGDVAMEIGPGVGYIMQAVMARFAPARIIGLDVAPAMIAHAKERLARDHIDTTNWSFEEYDGVTIPFAARSIDHVYSVACLQHVPKLHVYNLLHEILRVLRDGWAALHFLSFSFIPRQHVPFLDEVRQQLEGREGHWHHFYSKDELLYVLAALGAKDVSVTEHECSLWAVFRSPNAVGPGAPEIAPEIALSPVDNPPTPGSD